MASRDDITLTDKLMLLPISARAIAAAIARLITHPFVGGPKANTYFKDVVFAALRVNLSLMSPATEQYMDPGTEATYLEFAKKQGFQPETTVLGSGLKLHWLGPKSAEKVLIYLHGGGFALSASPGHFAWLFDLQNELSNSKHNISVVVPAYTLSYFAPYPQQLKEAAEALAWLIDTHKKKPSDIVLGGDSAGGNLAMSLMSHLLHPSDEIPSKIKLSEPLAGGLLISPWVKFATDDASIERNQLSDMVTPKAAERWSSMYLGSRDTDNYNQPILADSEWFKGLDKVVKDILVWGGGGEGLIDSIEAIGKKLKEAHPNTEVVVQPGASHEDFILDKLLGYKEKGEGTKLVESWMKARL